MCFWVRTQPRFGGDPVPSRAEEEEGRRPPSAAEKPPSQSHSPGPQLEREREQGHRCVRRCPGVSGAQGTQLRPLWEPGLPRGPAPALALYGKRYFQHGTWICVGFFRELGVGRLSRAGKKPSPRFPRETTLTTPATVLGPISEGFTRFPSVACSGPTVCGS